MRGHVGVGHRRVGVWWAVGLALVLAVLACECECWSTKDWYPHIGRGPSFKESAYVPVDMGTEGMDGRVVALGDVDGDSYTDLFVVSRGGTDRALDTVNVYGWDYWLYEFVPFPLIAVKEPDIRNVIPADFNGDGRMDLLVQGGSGTAFMASRDPADVKEAIDSEGELTSAREETGERAVDSGGTLPYLRLYFGDYQTFTDPVTLPLTSDMSVYDVLASAADLNGDTAVDLYLQRKYWLNEGTGETWRVVEQGEVEEQDIPPIADRHSNAFADVTGDCFPDLVLFTAGDEKYQKRMDSSQSDQESWPADATVTVEGSSSGADKGTAGGNGSPPLVRRPYESTGEYESTGDYESSGVDESSEEYESSGGDENSEEFESSGEYESSGEDDTTVETVTIGEYESTIGYESSGELVSSEDGEEEYVTQSADSEEEQEESSAAWSSEGESSEGEGSSEGESSEDGEQSTGIDDEDGSGSPSPDTEDSSVEGSPPRALEVWAFKHHQYQLQKTFALPLGTGRATFADVDSDGALDMLFTECAPAPSCSRHNKVHVAYNIQPNVCDGVTGMAGKDCLATSALCSATDWNFPDLTSGVSDSDIVIVSSDTFDDWIFVWEEESLGALSAPRMGDFNLDGYPDMLIVVLNKETGDRELQLLENVACDKNLCGSEATDAGRRTFSRLTEGVDALGDVKNVIDATFFDVDEDGDLDLLYNSRDDDDNVGRERVGLLYNALHIDSMFLKTMGSNGVCPQWCPSGEKFPDPKPVGVNYPGATFKYTMTDGAGKRIVATASQLSQTAGGLQLPYCLFGLGRTSSYVDYLFYGIATDTDSDCFFSWQGVIPNAQVAIFPYPYDTPASWFMLMYIHPSGIFFWVVVACVVCCGVLGTVYLGLHRREQLQDKKEVEEQAHLFL